MFLVLESYSLRQTLIMEGPVWDSNVFFKSVTLPANTSGGGQLKKSPCIWALCQIIYLGLLSGKLIKEWTESCASWMSYFSPSSCGNPKDRSLVPQIIHYLVLEINSASSQKGVCTKGSLQNKFSVKVGNLAQGGGVWPNPNFFFQNWPKLNLPWELPINVGILS